MTSYCMLMTPSSGHRQSRMLVNRTDKIKNWLCQNKEDTLSTATNYSKNNLIGRSGFPADIRMTQTVLVLFNIPKLQETPAATLLSHKYLFISLLVMTAVISGKTQT